MGKHSKLEKPAGAAPSPAAAAVAGKSRTAPSQSRDSTPVPKPPSQDPVPEQHTPFDESSTGRQAAEIPAGIEVLPISAAGVRPRGFLVLFHNVPKGDPRDASKLPPDPHLSPDEKDDRIAQLCRDLASARYQLQSLLEERDPRIRELFLANEEIRSLSRQLQSTSVELENTRRALQSANNNLQDVNDQLQQRNDILTQTGNDLRNLLSSVNIPQLILDTDLRIRQFTLPMQRLLNVRPEDIGRSIGEIRLQLSLENIVPILTDVLETLGARELEVQDRNGRWHLLRVRPYRTAENKIEGVVVVLVDIDQLRRSQQHLVYARDFARSLLESVPVPIVVLHQDFAIRTVNTAFRNLTRMSATELENRSLPELLKHLWAVDGLRQRLDTLLASPLGTVAEFEHESAAPRRKTLLIKAQALPHDGDRVLLLMLDDITLRRDTELLAARQKDALESEVESATAMLNRTQEELRSLTAHLFRVQEEERQRIARELHDDICQRLSLLEIALEEMRNESAAAAPSPRLHPAIELAQRLNSDVRQLSHGLHPAILKDLGLSAALRAMVKEFGDHEHMPATYLTKNLPEHWSLEAATAIYRIAQEALRNVAKHAGKTHVKVMLSGVKGRLQLRVMDFGVGFDQDRESPTRGLGKISMQERARLAGGVLNIKSSLGQGTTVTADIPL